MFDDNYHDDFDCKNNKCVCKTVRKIAEAQDEVAGLTDDNCDVSCKQSVRDLLSPTANGNGNDTVPFILYCKGTCHPFFGSSILQGTTGGGGGGRSVLRCFESPIFRVSKVKKNCCAEIELLLPVSQGGSTPGGGGDTVCDFFPGNSIATLQRTGLCITVDLCDFSGIACLEPTRPRPVSELNVSDDARGMKND
ncbi:CotY/CotZ family spore coat protein [Aquisalibacillus elongatus]|uniref:Spore coat protein Z n=1 Tax=Aquisalibacillus elongatus TaxID=485577 RepID=A0A3N5BUU9_9BACI|nr:CotY/CotZ family spore coat protein [Aquisalibacillus elongatus]RPF51152.1 spore coat protein Z [Aquisalibacillus elongatus]